MTCTTFPLPQDILADSGGPIGANDSRSRQQTFIIPEGNVAVGQLQFSVTTEAGNAFFEYNANSTGETNNNATTTINVSLAPYADLAISNVTSPTLVIGDPATVTVAWRVANVGEKATGIVSWIDQVIASKDAIAGNSDDILLGSFSRWIDTYSGYDVL